VLRSRVGTIIDDDEGHLWLGVRAGIVRISPAEFDSPTGESRRIRYALYDASDGLRGDLVPLGYPGVVRTPDGTLWFVTTDGLAVVDPHRLSKTRLAPPVAIEGVIADERQVEPLAGLPLPPLTSILRVDYTALSFAAPAHVHFRYRLDGFDNQWVDAGARRQAFYTNLPPRRYRFRVTAENESGADWEFSIRPTFYQTAWFYAACTMLSLLAGWAAWRARVGQVRRGFTLVLAERARIAREIHDTLLQSLVGVAVQFTALSTELESSPVSAKEHLTKLRRQIEIYIREARRSIWDLRSPTLDARDLAAALRLTGEQMIGDTPLRLEFRVSGTPRRCSPRVEEQLLRIGQEAISNAVRHAQATSVLVELAYGDRSMLLRIVDDGRGFDPEDPGSQVHWGLAIMNERAQLIGARLEIVSRPGRGTRIELVVPSFADEGTQDGIRDWPGRASAPLSAPDGLHNV
jgi:signal transduction histidine kinase